MPEIDKEDPEDKVDTVPVVHDPVFITTSKLKEVWDI